MRSEAEILNLILAFANEQDTVRAVVMNGSRANPNCRRDPFQDFDIVYLTTDVPRFVRQAWIPSYFGQIMILQLPDDMADPPPSPGWEGYTYLMQFTDGSRIDLGFEPVARARISVSDSLSVVLLDKDHLLDGTPAASERDYLPTRPTAKAFEDCCNEFWWVNPYVAKGLWREELPYAKHLMEVVLRPELMKILTWEAGARTRYEVSMGKFGKHLKKHLEPPDWDGLLSTYTDWRPENMWRGLYAAQELFRTVAVRVARSNGWLYPEREDRLVSDYVRRIQQLAPDAMDF